MANICRLTLGAYQTNTYLVWAEGSKSCCVIDPGYEPKTVLDKARALGLRIDTVLLTHGHFDHVGAVKAIWEQTGCALWMNKSDWAQKPGPITAMLYPLANCGFTQVRFCQDGQVISAGGLALQAIATPGHTPGSMCYICGDALFAGDTLFAGSCGRTDLPGGDGTTMLLSLQRLSRLTEDYTVYPGHGESTTLAREKQYNPYMQ